MKKLLLAIPALTLAAASFAEGGESTPIISEAQVGEMFSSAQSSMTSLVSTAMPVVLAFLGGGLVLWGAFALFKIVKRAFGAGKGR